ncbi:MAG: GPR endopeptidase [Oscillospiraceae bacterium]|nr:GPR endopeptidase [Oscillospiraceae bacterium]
MPQIRTDLAVESHELWQEQQSTALEGVDISDSHAFDCDVHTVRILDERGERALGKPAGQYVTIELPSLRRHDAQAFDNSTYAAAQHITQLLPSNATAVLIVGLGNKNITPDAVGPLAVESTVVTRHLVQKYPEHFGALRPVSALSPGVLASTGMESADVIRGVVDSMHPDCLLVVDALASRKLSRLCRTVQICDTGIVPGSGVGNARAALNAQTLGVPVIAVGIPTVVDAATLAADLLEEAGQGEVDPQALNDYGGSLIVTPKDIDALVKEVARVVGYGISLALHKEFTLADVRGFLA